MSINQETFQLFIEQIVKAKIPEFTVTPTAVDWLQIHTEKYLEDIVSAAEECRIHTKESTLQAEDIRLTLALKKRTIPFCLK